MKKDYKHEMPYSDGWKKQTGKLPVSMTNDYLFRALLQADEKTLIALISSLLNLKRREIKSVLVTNPIELGESIREKEIRLDVSVVLNNEKKINLEMQVAHREGWIERTLLYISRSFDQLNRGEIYADIRPVIQISFTDFTIIADAPEFFATYKWINEKNISQVYSDKMIIKNVNLSRIDLATDEDKKQGIDRWAKIFKATTWEELKMLATADKKSDQAISSIWQLTEDEKIRDQILFREENEREYNHMMDVNKTLQKKVSEQSSKISEQSSRISAQDNKISELNCTISEQSSKILEQSSKISELEQIIRSLQDRIDKKE